MGPLTVERQPGSIGGSNGRTRPASGRQARPFERLSGALVGAVLMLAPLQAQQATFVDRTEVRAVHLDVLVLGRDGEPLTSLVRDDFEVRRDGEEVALDFFAQPKIERRGAEAADRQAVDAPSRESTDPVEWIVFVDDLRLDGGTRKRVLRDLEELFADWSQTSSLRLVLQRGSEVVEKGPFSSPEELVRALRERPKGVVGGVMTKIARRQTMERLGGVREACALSGRDLCRDCWGEQLAVATRHAVDEVQRIERTVRELRTLMTRLDSTAGRRAVLYVGDGLPLLAGAAVFWSLGEQCPDRRTEIEGEVAAFRLERLLEEVGALANAQRIALHLLDAGGLRDSTSLNDSEHYRNLQAGLQTLAEQTGGEAILNANRAVEPVAVATAREAARYELGFTMSTPPTGRVHRIEVSLRPGVAAGAELRYRKTYWDRTSDMRFFQSVLATGSRPQAPGSATDSELIALRLAPGGTGSTGDRAEDGADSERVVLQIAVSSELAVVLPVEGEEESGSLSVAILLTDESGRGGEPRIREIPLGDGGLVVRSGWYFVEIGLEPERDDRLVVVGVRDAVTGQVATSRLALP